MAEKKEVTIKAKKSPKIILGILFLTVFLAGWFLGHQDYSFTRFGFTPKILNKNSQGQDVDFGSFWRTWDLLEKNFDGKLDAGKMVEGAIRGMTQALSDPYTVYMSTDEAKQLEDDLSGTVSGIGAEIGIKDGRITVISPIDDSPAKKAGIQSGDVILSVDGESTEGMTVAQAVSKIRGEAGTKVKIIILRSGQQKDFEITREKFNVKSVKSEIKNNNIGYVSIRRFDENTDNELKNALNNFTSKGVKKIILDLRDNPGGYLDQSIDVASEFIGQGVIVSEKKDSALGKKEEYKATGDGIMIDQSVKIIVLTNQGSASASEIVAGALKDHKRATLIGEKTFGKGSVQKVEDLPGGAKLKVTIAHWYTPNGKNISKEGIAPDIEIKLTDDDYNKNRDPQLDKALEIFK